MGGWLGGWVAGSNGNKANLSPAEAGAGLSLAISDFQVKMATSAGM